jgi:hypothetical protein
MLHYVLDLGTHLGEPVKAASIERLSPAFLEGGALEAFTDPLKHTKVRGAT